MWDEGQQCWLLGPGAVGPCMKGRSDCSCVFVVSDCHVEGMLVTSAAGLVNGGKTVICVVCTPCCIAALVEGGHWPELGCFPIIPCTCLAGLLLFCGDEIFVL